MTESEKEDPWIDYFCTTKGCDYVTKQKRIVKEVLHLCPKTKSLKVCKPR